MIFNYLFGIYCSICKKYKNPHTEIYLPDGSENEGRICCLDCNNIVGYTFDLSWIEYWREKCL